MENSVTAPSRSLYVIGLIECFSVALVRPIMSGARRLLPHTRIYIRFDSEEEELESELGEGRIQIAISTLAKMRFPSRCQPLFVDHLEMVTSVRNR
jgi:hypothetical protein